MNNLYPEDSNYLVPSKICLWSINEENEKLSQEKVRKIYFFFPPKKCFFQGKGSLKISSLTAEKKQTKSRRLLREICNFTHLYHYLDSFIAVLILPDMPEKKK